MQRILVIGPSGAGKSTLARQLQELTGIFVIHLDQVYWHPNWKETSRNEWRILQENLVQRPTWIIDGNYGATLDIRLQAADTVIFLDFPRRLCLWRVLKRLVQYRGRSRPDMAPGCPEKIDREFLRWIWRWPVDERPLVMARLSQAPNVTQITLKTPRQVRDFLARMAQQCRGQSSQGEG